MSECDNVLVCTSKHTFPSCLCKVKFILRIFVVQTNYNYSQKAIIQVRTQVISVKVKVKLQVFFSPSLNE